MPNLAKLKINSKSSLGSSTPKSSTPATQVSGVGEGINVAVGIGFKVDVGVGAGVAVGAGVDGAHDTKKKRSNRNR